MKTISTFHALIAFLLLGFSGCKDYLPEIRPEKVEYEGADNEVSDGNEIICSVEQMPEFLGGNDVLPQFIQTHLRYPKTNACVNGVVYVSFVVREDGTVTDIKIAKGLHEAWDKEAMRVVALLPPWKPGVQSGMPVPVRFILPIRVGIIAEKIAFYEG